MIFFLAQCDVHTKTPAFNTHFFFFNALSIYEAGNVKRYRNNATETCILHSEESTKRITMLSHLTEGAKGKMSSV